MSPAVPTQGPDQLIQVGHQQPIQTQRDKQLRDQKEALDAMGMRRGRPGETTTAGPLPHPAMGAAIGTSVSAAPNFGASSHSRATTAGLNIASNAAPPASTGPAKQLTSSLPTRQPLAPLTRSRPSKSGSRDSQHQNRHGPGASPSSPTKQPTSSSPRKSAATPVSAGSAMKSPTRPGGGVRVMPMPGGRSATPSGGAGLNGARASGVGAGGKPVGLAATKPSMGM